MKINRGFTLIELTGVIVVIGLLLLFTLPRIIQNMDNVNQREYERMAKDLEIATETYIETNRDLFPDLDNVGAYAFINVDELVTAGLVRRDLINPKTSEIINTKATIIVKVLSDGTKEYTFNENDATLDGYNQSGLILHYDGYKQPTSNSWMDISGNNNTGTLINFDGTTSSGWQGTYMQFDGNNDVVTVPSLGTVPVAYTVSMLVNISDYKDKTYNGISLTGTRGAAWNDQVERGFEVYMEATTKKTGIFLSDGTNYNVTSGYGFTGAYTVELNQPVLITFTKTANNATLYINGNKYQTVTHGSAINSATPSRVLTINGRGGSASGYTTVMKLYSYRFYNRALTDQEVQNNYSVDQARFGL